MRKVMVSEHKQQTDKKWKLEEKGEALFHAFGTGYESGALAGWLPIDTAPMGGRELILLKTPGSPDGCIAYSNTWWTAGFSVECKPTHWKPANVEVRGCATSELSNGDCNG